MPVHKTCARPYSWRMAKKSTKRKKPMTGAKAPQLRSWRSRMLRLGMRCIGVMSVLLFALILLWSVANPPRTLYMLSEGRRLGGIDHQWVSLDEIAPVMARSVVAAEDANFCNHWGFDLAAIKLALAQGSNRGASTISQQTVKNVYLWQGRSWPRKALEALITPLMELVWTKRRIVEVYLNIAEFDEGVFGIEAAARHYFGVGPDQLSPTQAAQLAAILPSPKKRSASKPSKYVRKRASQIRSGAATIRADGRASCFES